MDQTSIPSAYLNLDALSSSSDEESLNVKKCEDSAATIVCSSEEAGTRVNSEEVLSVEVFSGCVRSKRHSTGRPVARQSPGRSDH